MATNAVVGSLAWSSSHTAGTTYTINLPAGFDPKLARFWMMGSGSATDAVGSDDADASYGFATGTASRRSISAWSQDNAGSSVCYRAHRNDAVLVFIRGAGTAGLLDVTTWSSDTIVLTVDQQANNDVRVGYEIVGGSDIGNVAIGDLTTPTTNGVVSYTGPGFLPKGVQFIAPGFSLGFTATPAINQHATQGQLMIGAASGSAAGEQAVLHVTSRHSQAAADTFGYGLGGECIATMNGSGSIFEVGVLDALDSDGFDIDWTVTGAGASVNSLVSWLAWDGAPTKVGSFLSQSSGTGTFNESVGLQPVTASFFSALRAESTTSTPTANAALSIGAATSATERHAQAYLDADGADPTDVTVAVEYDALYADLSSGTLDGTIDLDSYAASDPEMVLDQTDADPAQNFVAYIATGAASEPIDNDQLAMMGFAASGGGLLPWTW